MGHVTVRSQPKAAILLVFGSAGVEVDAIDEMSVAAGRLGEAQGIEALRHAVDDLTVGQVRAPVLDDGDVARLADHEAQAHGAVETRVALHSVAVTARE